MLQGREYATLPLSRNVSSVEQLISWLLRTSQMQDASFPRLTVFKNLHQIPWQIAPSSLPEGLPAGISPGHTRARVLFKMLSRSGDGSTTVLIKFPPGRAFAIHLQQYLWCSNICKVLERDGKIIFPAANGDLKQALLAKRKKSTLSCSTQSHAKASKYQVLALGISSAVLNKISEVEDGVVSDITAHVVIAHTYNQPCRHQQSGCRLCA